MIHASGITKTFGRTAALRGIDLRVQSGEVLALLGANGAGKTTLLRLLATLEKPSAGCLTIAGLDVLREPQRVRAMVGLVGHHNYLHSDLTASEELLFYGRLYGVEDARRRAAGLLEEVGLGNRSALRVGALSRGQQQRLGIARALVHDPPLLLLDEPDTGLDAEGLQLLEQLIDGASRAGRTVIFSSHDREWASRHSARTVILAAGSIRHK